MNCPFCDQIIPDGSTFCGYCGNKLDGEGQSQEEISESVYEEQTGEEAYATATDAEAPEEAETFDRTPEESETAFGTDFNEAPQAATDNQAASQNDVVDQLKNGIRDAAQTARTDTQQAVADVKNGNFKSLLKNKTFIICCAAIIAVIILVVVIVIINVAAGSKYKVKGFYYRTQDDDEVTYLYNGRIVEGVDLSSDSSMLARSLDGTVALVMDDGELYIFRNGKSDKITNDFNSNVASLSSDGKVVAYPSDDALYVYTGGKPKKIADIEDDRYCKPVISPNGKVIAYADYDDDDVKTYAWKGGKPIDLDAKIIPYSVSNGGSIIFGKTLDSDLRIIRNLKKSADEKIEENTDVAGISMDHTKLLYTSDGETYCFDTSIDGEEGVRIAKDYVSPFSDFTYRDNIPYVENFKEFYGEKKGNVYRFFRKGKSYDDEKIISDANNLMLSEDNKSFVYIDDGDIMKGTLSNAKNAKEIGKDARSFIANETLSSVFYIDDDDNLRYAGKDGKITSDVSRYDVTDEGVCVFSDKDGDLYYSSKGGEKQKAGLDDITSIYCYKGAVYVVSDGELYISKNGKSFEKTGLDVDRVGY